MPVVYFHCPRDENNRVRRSSACRLDDERPCTVARAATSDDRLVACLIGNAGVSLHKQIGTQVNAKAATDAAVTYADKQCKGGRLSEASGDYVYYSINAMAKEWFKE